jgi:hypothetical protein
VVLPFHFCFYGEEFDTVYISNNGIVSFRKPIYNFLSSGSFPLGTDTLVIAPFYADAYTRDTFGLVFYKIAPTYMVVEWDSVAYSTADKDFFNTFQLIISDGNDPILPLGTNVSFCHVNMQWATADASGGLNGFSGLSAIVGVNRGNKSDYAQMGRFSVPGITYYGPYAAFDGLQWLNNKAFAFSTCTTGNIPPVLMHANQGCDTIKVCEGMSAKVGAAFLNVQKGQTSSLRVVCEGISNFTIIDSSKSDGIDSVTVQLSPQTGEAGAHVLNITATDNSTPTQTSSHTFTVMVDACSGINEVALNDDVSIFPNPSNGRFNLKINNQVFLNSEARIFDPSGREIYSVKLNNFNTEIRLPFNFNGLYFLNLYRQGAPSVVKKIIIL